jgi:hypothetical protein
VETEKEWAVVNKELRNMQLALGNSNIVRVNGYCKPGKDSTGKDRAAGIAMEWWERGSLLDAVNKLDSEVCARARLYVCL